MLNLAPVSKVKDKIVEELDDLKDKNRKLERELRVKEDSKASEVDDLKDENRNLKREVQFLKSDDTT